MRILRLLLFISFSLFTASANKPNVVNFYRDKYQAANKNWSIAQDSLGVMYFGNDKGLLEFDGIRWKLYSLPTAEVVRAVGVSSNNLIFTGGYEEFGMWKRDSSGELVYTSLSWEIMTKGLKNDDIWKIWVTDKLVYFQSFKRIYAYDYHKVSVVDDQNDNILFLLHVYDEFWFQKMGGGLYRLESSSIKEIPGSSFLKEAEVRVILPFSDHRYLIGTSNLGLFIFDGNSFRPWDSEFSKAVKPFELNNGILRKNGNYYFGTILNGAYEVSPTGSIINHFSTNNFLQNNTVLSLFEDNLENIWIAMDRGISYVQYLRGMDCYIDPLGKFGAVYTASYLGNKLYIGTNQGVYTMSKSESPTNLQLIEGTQGQIWDMKIVGERLLCGHNRGLKVINKDNQVETIWCSGVFKIQNLEKEPDKVLLGTYNSTVLYSVKENRTQTLLKNFMEPVIAVETDYLGNVWLGHAQKGVYRCRFTNESENLKLYKTFGGNEEDQLPFHLRLFKLNGRIIFYGDNKFYIYNDLEDLIVPYEDMNEFFSGINSLKNIIPLSKNLFFAITNNCVYKFIFDGYDFRFIDKYDIGHNNLSLVNISENAVALNDSMSLICLDNGFLLHHNNQSATNKNTRLPIPHIRSVTTFNAKNKKRFLQQGVDNRISYSYNTVLFDFFSKNVLADNLSFQYKLEGVNVDWSKPADIHEAIFQRLPKGKYTFLLRTVDNLGNHSEPIRFSFLISPPWYANLWAYIAYMAIFMIAMFGIWFTILRRYRNIHLLKVRVREERRLRKQNLNLRMEIEEKDAELFSKTSFIIQKNELIMKVKKEIDDFYHSYSGNKILKPLYEKVSGLLEKNMDIDEDWKMFLIQFEQNHKGFFKRMKEIQPDLTSSDLKLCACLKLNLSSKDIASLTNISIRAVENNRYRLRKKLNIPQTQHLSDYFMQF